MVGVGLIRPQAVSIEKDAATMSRFLNRILGLPVQLQNQLFSYFSDTLAAVVLKAKRTGSWDGGILDFGSVGEHVAIVNTEQFAGDPAVNIASTQLLTVKGGNLGYITWDIIYRVADCGYRVWQMLFIMCVQYDLTLACCFCL